MSEMEYNSLSQQCIRPSIQRPFSHGEDLFSHAHRMLIDDNQEESRGMSSSEDGRRPISPRTDVGKGTTSFRRGRSDHCRTKKTRTVVFRSPPPLLPMSPAFVENETTTSIPFSKHQKMGPTLHYPHTATSGSTRRVTPPPLLPMPALALCTTHSPPSPSLSPPSSTRSSPLSQRTPPLTTPPSTPPGKIPTPPHPGWSCLTRMETEEELLLKRKACAVCGDLARSLHFGGLACDSCKAFFRRAVLSNAFTDFVCWKDHHCTITVKSRRSCQACRFAGCLRAGMEVSLAKREDEATGRTLLPSLDHHRRMERPTSIRSHERLHSHNPIYGKSTHTVSSYYYSGHLVGCSSLAQGPGSLAQGPGSLVQGPGSFVQGSGSLTQAQGPTSLAHGPTSLAQGPTSLAQGPTSLAPGPRDTLGTLGSVLKHAKYNSQAGGPASCHSPLSRGSSVTLASSCYGAMARGSPISSHTSMSTPSSNHSPMTFQSPSTSHTTLTNHTPAINHTSISKSHSPTKNHTLTNSNHTPSLAYPHTTISLSHCRRSPMAPWTGMEPADPPPEEHHSISPNGNTDDTSSFGCSRLRGTGDSVISHTGHEPRTHKFEEEVEAHLDHRDHTEIEELHKSYSSTFDAKTLPVGERMIRSEELSKLYTCFIQRRARFLVSTPLYRSLAESDRLKLLHVAVAMSTYFTGAHLIDTKDYTWKDRNSADDKTFPVMSASTIRQFLSHEQFVYVMRFYTTYSPVFSDQTVAILMQVLSLFYPEPGLADPHAAEEGRLHYLALLSRYLRATYGPQAGAERLRTLINSQQEARQLVDLLQHVELTPQVPRQDVVDSHRILMEGIQLVCDRARESLAKGVTERRAGPHTHNSWTPEGVTPANTSSVDDDERLDFIEKTFNRLATCEDPYILAEARRILPADLIRRFFQQLQRPAASNT